MKRAGRQRARSFLVQWRANRICGSEDAESELLGWLEAEDTTGWLEAVEDLTAQLPPRSESTP